MACMACMEFQNFQDDEFKATSTFWKFKSYLRHLMFAATGWSHNDGRTLRDAGWGTTGKEIAYGVWIIGETRAADMRNIRASNLKRSMPQGRKVHTAYFDLCIHVWQGYAGTPISR